MSTHKVIIPSEDPDLHGLPKTYQWRCICIATAGLLGVTVVCSIVAAVSSILALPLFLFGMPLLLIAEVIFSIVYVHKLAILNVQPIKHEPDNYDPERTFDKFIRQIKQFEEVEQYLSLWFFGADFSVIKRQNVEEFVAYAFWYRQREVLLAEGKGPLLSRMVSRLESTWGMTFAPGHTPGLRFMSHLWEPIQHFYRPLAFYLWSEAMAGLTHVFLTCAGFRARSFMGVTYYVRNMSARNSPSRRRKSRDSDDELEGPQPMPLVLLHGVGMGLLPYLGLLVGLAAAGHPLLAPQWRHVSMRLCLSVPTVDEVAEAVMCMMRCERLPVACLVGHSYGTAVASRLLQAAPQRVHSLALLDPVCFGMFMPNMLRNFLYKSPSRSNLMADVMMWTAARDLHCSAAMSRKFFWSAVNLWEEQLPGKCLVVLSGRDVLVPVREVRMWLEWQTDATIMFHPHLAHAAICLDISWQRQVIAQLLVMLKDGCRQQAARAASHQPRPVLMPALPAPTGRPVLAAPSSTTSSGGSTPFALGSSPEQPARPISLLSHPAFDYQQLMPRSEQDGMDAPPTPASIGSPFSTGMLAGPGQAGSLLAGLPGAVSAGAAAGMAAAGSRHSTSPFLAAAAAAAAAAAEVSAAGTTPLDMGSGMQALSRSQSLEPVYESAEEGDGSLYSVGLSSTGTPECPDHAPGTFHAASTQQERSYGTQQAAGSSSRVRLTGASSSSQPLERSDGSGVLAVAGAEMTAPTTAAAGQEGSSCSCSSSSNGLLLNKQVNAGRRLQVMMGGMRSPGRGSLSSSRRSSVDAAGQGLAGL